MSGIRLTAPEEAEIVAAYLAGESGTSLAKRLGRGDNTVYEVLRRSGCQIRPAHSRKLALDDHFFDMIDTHQKAYWLGFLTADGCVKQNRVEMHINLQISDKDHLEELRTDLRADTTVKMHRNGSDKDGAPERRIASFLVRSAPLCQALIGHGVIPRKSTVQPAPVGVPDSLRAHYVRGYFDGNGSIWGHGRTIHCSLVGSWELMTWMADAISESCGVAVSAPKARGKQAIVEIRGAGKLTLLRSFLYPDEPGIRMLERKWMRFQEVQVRNEKRVEAWRRQQEVVAS